MKKRILSVLLAACMAFGLMPFAFLPASADSSSAPGVTTTAPVGNLSLLKAFLNAPNAATVYFGTKTDGKPAAFRIIGDTDEGIKGYTDTMTFLSAGLTAKDVPFDSNGNSHVYSSSSLRKAVNNAVMLKSGEKKAVSARQLVQSSEKEWGIAGDTVFDCVFWPLSTHEATLVNGELLKAEDDWWTCSPGDAIFAAGCVRKDGTVVPGGNFVSYGSGVRSAFFLKQSSVLFASAAVGGKTRAVVGGPALKSLAPASDAQEKGLKLTLKDEAHAGFKVTKFRKAGENQYTIHYENAQTGANEYLSYYVLDAGGNVVAYGKICKATDAKGTLTFKTCKLYSGEKLYVINEQANGDYATDFSSLPQGYDMIEGDYAVVAAMVPGKCFDIAGGANAKSVGDLLQIWDTSGSGAREYNIKYDENAGAYTITAKQSGLVLDDCGNGNVAQWTSHGGWNQRWVFEPLGNGFYFIRNRQTGKYLTIANNAAANGTKIYCMNFTGEWRQQFGFVPISELEPEEGRYIITSFSDSSKCFDIAGGAGSTGNGQNLWLWDVSESTAKHYTLTKDKSNGSFTIMADHSGKLLTADSNLSADKKWVNVFQSSGSLFDGKQRQRWTFYPFGNGVYMIRSNQTGFFLNAASGTLTNGTDIIAFDDARAIANQMFCLVRAREETSEQPEDGDYIIYTALNDKKCLDVAGGVNALSNGDKLQIWDESSSGAKVYNLKFDEKTGGYIITAKQSGLVLDVSGGSMADGATVWQWEDLGGLNQRWIFEPADDGCYYIRAMQGQYLNVSGGSTSNGSKLISFRFEGGDNEMFKLQRVYVNRYGTIKYEKAGSVLSGGNLWILIAVGGLAVIGVAAAVIFKKKKKRSAAEAAPADFENEESKE